MKIGIVTTKIGLNDGQGRVNYEIAAEAVRRGHKLVLFCEHVDPELVGRDDVRLELMSPPRWLPTRLLRDQLFAWRSYRKISTTAKTDRELCAHSCDVILANGFTTWAAADVNAVHFVHDAWRRSVHHPWRKRRSLSSIYQIVYNRLNAVLERVALRRAAAIVAVSATVRQELVDIGMPSATITTIVCGVDTEAFHPGVAERSRFGLPDGPVVALFVGDLSDSRKNLETVLKTLAHVPDLHLAVAGRHEGTVWPRLAEKLNITDRVHFLGFRRDMPELMRASDVFIFPSRYEPFGLVFLEALASGLPVVTSRSAGGAEIITPQVGFVVEDSEDVEALTGALLSLASSAEKREIMALAARSKALQYSWPEMGRRYIDLLEETAGQAKRKVVGGRAMATY